MSRSIRTATVAVLALAVAATAADAARPKTGVYKGKTSQNLNARFTVHRKGRRVDFRITYAKETNCTGNSTFVAGNTDLGTNVPVKKDGTFTFTFSNKQPVTINGQSGASDHYNYTVTGTFKGKSVKGTFQEKDDIYDPSGNLYGSCSTTGVTYKAKRK